MAGTCPASHFLAVARGKLNQSFNGRHARNPAICRCCLAMLN